MDTVKQDHPRKYGVMYKTFSYITLWQKLPTLFLSERGFLCILRSPCAGTFTKDFTKRHGKNERQRSGLSYSPTFWCQS